jgi:tetratricopeptide (TPR) repeat protein
VAPNWHNASVSDLEGPLAALADAAAAQLVTAMAGDEQWWVARIMLVYWVRQQLPDRADATHAALAELRCEMLNRSAGDGGIAADLRASWRERLFGLLDIEPRLADPLRELVRRDLAELTPVEIMHRVADGPDLARALVRFDQAMRSDVMRSLGPASTTSMRPVEEAVVVAGEAVEAYRRLSAADPPRHGADLLRALLMLTSALLDAWEIEQAAAVGAELLAMREHQGDATDGSLAWDEALLARTIVTLGERLRDWDRAADVLAFLRAGVGAYRRLAEADTARFRRPLSDALVTLHYAAYLDREGLVAIEEAVDLRRELAVADPASHLTAFGEALGLLGDALSSGGDNERLAVVAGEKIEVYRRLVAVDAATHDPALASALSDRGRALANEERYEEAVLCLTEAVQIERRMPAPPDGWHPSLANSLHLLSVSLWELGRQDEAVSTALEGIEVDRNGLAGHPSADHEPLALACNNVGFYLSQLGRHPEALAATAESVQTYRQGLGGTAADLAFALWTFAEARLAAGRELDEASTAIDEAVAIYEELSANLPEHQDDLEQVIAMRADISRNRAPTRST